MPYLNVFSACARLRFTPETLPTARRFALRTLSLFLLSMAVSAPIFAQQFATLNLTVGGPSGSVISGAKASIRSTDTGVLRNSVSDKLGQVFIPGLPAGEYSLTVDADGFSAYQAPLTLTLGETASLQVVLRIHAAAEQVVVHDTTVGVDEERTEGSQVIQPEQISDLPIADRDFIDFVLLTPTATVGRNSSSGAQSAFRKQSWRSASEAFARRIASFTDWMASTTRRQPQECSESAHRWIGCRSFAWSMALTRRAAD